MLRLAGPAPIREGGRLAEGNIVFLLTSTTGEPRNKSLSTVQNNACIKPTPLYTLGVQVHSTVLTCSPCIRGSVSTSPWPCLAIAVPTCAAICDDGNRAVSGWLTPPLAVSRNLQTTPRGMSNFPVLFWRRAIDITTTIHMSKKREPNKTRVRIAGSH